MSISTIILSLTPLCNLACSYCQNEPAFDKVSCKRMSDDMIDKVINSLEEMAKYNQKSVTFCFSGGEPLTVGLSFFQKIIDKQKKLASICKIRNIIQTNGTLIDEKWASFFKENQISISVSVDGPGFIHDNQRFLRNSSNSCINSVVNGINHLQNNQINYGTLTVITNNSINYANEIFEFISTLKPNMMGFLPCVDRGPKISAKQYGYFMVQLFDAWLEKNDSSLLVREFVHIIQGMLNIPHTKGCQFAGVCPLHINVSPTGIVSVCDQYLEKPEGYLGDLNKETISHIVCGEKFSNFREKTEILSVQCKDCRFLPICNGGCAYRRNNFTTVDYLCEGRKQLFEHIENKIDQKLNSMVEYASKAGMLA